MRSKVLFCPHDSDNNVEMIRVRATDINNGKFNVNVIANTLAGKAVPGLDGAGVFNQDFALYVFGADLQ